MIKDKLDILIIAESKLDPFFPSNQFSINGFKRPIRLDITSDSGGLLIYARGDILCKKIEIVQEPNNIQAIPLGLNIRKQKLLILFTGVLDKTLAIYKQGYSLQGYRWIHSSRENMLLIGDFNMEVNDRAMSPLTEAYQLSSLFKGPTCFKSRRG